MVFKRGWLTVPVMVTTPGMLFSSLPRWDDAVALVVPPRGRRGRGGVAEPGPEPLLGGHGGPRGRGHRRWGGPGPRPGLLVERGIAPIGHFFAFPWCAGAGSSSNPEGSVSSEPGGWTFSSC